MLWQKPKELKYTDLCIYIDQHAKEAFRDNDEEVQSIIYNYIWLLVKALAIKKQFFDRFDDYDGYTMYSATRLFYALKKNFQNEGKVIKGKTIKPIKSILNYTKLLLYPMKLEYLREQYDINLTNNYEEKDLKSLYLREDIKQDVYLQQNMQIIKLRIHDLIRNLDNIIEEILADSPFKKSSSEYANLKTSILLSYRLALKLNHNLNLKKFPIVLWGLSKPMAAYVKVFVQQINLKFKSELTGIYQVNVSDKILNSMITLSEGNSYE